MIYVQYIHTFIGFRFFFNICLGHHSLCQPSIYIHTYIHTYIPRFQNGIVTFVNVHAFTDACPNKDQERIKNVFNPKKNGEVDLWLREFFIRFHIFSTLSLELQNYYVRRFSRERIARALFRSIFHPQIKN